MPRRRASGALESILPGTLLGCLALAVGAWLLWDAFSVPLVTYGGYSDYWEHTAALTEWMRNPSAPTNPHVVSPDLSSRYMPYFWVLSRLGLVLNLSAVQLMSISAIINYCVIVAGLQLFMRDYFRDSWAPLIGFIAIFMVWGVGWNWSNLYQLRSFFYTGSYPSSFVFGLSLISFWVTLRLLANRGSPIVLGASLAVLAALMLLCHPLTGVFGIIGCVLLTFTQPGMAISLRFAALGALLGGALVVELWPFFSVWKLMLGGYGAGLERWGSVGDLDPLGRLRSGAWSHLFYNPSIMLNMLGPALLGIPVLLWLLLKREHMFFVLGAVIMAIPYLANLFVEIPLAHRFLLFVVTFLQFALVWFVLAALTVCRTEPRPAFSTPALWALWLAIIAIVGGNFALLAGEYRGFALSPENLQFRDKRALLPPGQNVIDVYATLTEPLAEDAIVLTTAALGWPLPTVKGKVVSLYHENPLLLDQVARYQATGNFMYRPVNDTQRAEIITRYDVSHILISERDQELRDEVFDWLARYAEPVSEVESYRMYRVLDSVPRVVPEPEVTVKKPAPARAPVPPTPTAPEPDATRVDSVGRELPDTSVPDAEPAPQEEPVTSFGAPIADPIINVPEEFEPDIGTLPAPEPRTEPEQVEDVFGAPIAEPVLDAPGDESAPAAE